MGVLKKFLIYIFKKEISSLLYWIWRGKNRKKNINPDCLRTSTSTILSYKSTEFSSILNSNKVLYENSQRHKNLKIILPPLTKIEQFWLKTQKTSPFFRKHWNHDIIKTNGCQFADGCLDVMFIENEYFPYIYYLKTKQKVSSTYLNVFL